MDAQFDDHATRLCKFYGISDKFGGGQEKINVSALGHSLNCHESRSSSQDSWNLALGIHFADAEEHLFQILVSRPSYLGELFILGTLCPTLPESISFTCGVPRELQETEKKHIAFLE